MTDFIINDTVKTNYWHQLDDGHIQCDLCPRFCKLHSVQRGLCFVRQNLNELSAINWWRLVRAI